MKKITILFAILLLTALTTGLFSNPIGNKKAEKIAKNFYLERGQQELKNLQLDNINLQLYLTKENSERNLYYVFNVANKLGYIIVSADDDAYPVIAYSFKGNYDSENLPPAFKYRMNEYERQIIEIQTEKLKADENIRNEWERLLVPNYNAKSIESVSPLVTSTWSQGTYYNTDCPVDAAGPDGHALVGCVATAMGQIMNYHSYPEHGIGTHSYNHSTYGTISADFGNTTYDWSSIPNNASGYNSALALINFHCGVSVSMDYGPDGSGASTSYVSTALVVYFNYAATANYVNKSSYTTAGWEDILTNELDNGRPMEYRGGGPNGGHAFVCDGYQTSSYFHFNWGWGGYADGYFYLNNLNPGGYTFNDGQAAVIGIEPANGGGTFNPPTNLSVTEDGYATWEESGTSMLKLMHNDDDNSFTLNEAIEKNSNNFVETDVNAKPRSVDNSRAIWDTQYSFDIDGSSGLTGLAGAESDGEFIYATKWSSSSDIVKYTVDGTYVETFQIPGVSSVRDLAFDGTYMYGAAASTTVYKMDFTSHTLISSFTAPIDVRAIAYDAAANAFWGNNWSTDLVLFSESGASLDTISAPPSMYGAAYDNFTVGGPFLWVFTGTITGGGCQIEQIDIATGNLTGVSHSVSNDYGAYIAGGLYITEDLVTGKRTIGGTAQGTPDLAFGYEIDPSGGNECLGYNIYIDNAFVDFTPNLYWQYTGLTPGETYLAGVTALYDDGESEVIEYEFTVAGDHFTPIWTGNPYQPMTILLSSAIFDGNDFAIDDEIGVFDVDGSGNEICVGYGLVAGIISQGTPLTITVSADDSDTPEMDGFITGNTILYKAWSSADQTEFSSYQATYNPALDNNFTPLGTALVDVEFNSSITQTIELSQGWNIMSFYVTPDDMNMLSILDPLVTSSELTKVINEAGGFIQYIPGVGWMNTIGDMANTEGYYIKVTNSTSLDATGMAVDSPFTIPLNSGWNMMSYPMEQPEDAIVILQPLIDANELTKVINEAGGFIQFIPGVGWMNTIGNLEGGEGYYIKVNANTSLTIGGTSSTWQCGDPFEDTRDGQTYNTVQIGNQCWMAENLNIGTRIDGVSEQTNNSTIEKYCYDDDVANCDTYGGLYQWDEMMQYLTTEGVQGICPDGWHLPTDDEWKIMEMELGMTQVLADNLGWRGTDEGEKMKSTSGWYDNGNGTNNSGFTALPGGYCWYSGGSFNYIENSGYWWSSSEYSGSYALYRQLKYDYNMVSRSAYHKTLGHSVRCLKNPI